MPTVTTTVTSTEAAGSTTVTTTQSSPEPAAAAAVASTPPLPCMCPGKIIMGQHFHFQSQADRDTFNAALSPISALTNSNGGKSCVYNMATAPTELSMVYCWDSAASFALTETLFSQTTAITSMLDRITCEAYFCGDVKAETKAILAKWNEVPGFTIQACETELGYSDGTPLAHDGLGAFGITEFPDASSLDAYTAEMKTTAAIWIAKSSVVCWARISPTKLVSIWFLRSKADALVWLNDLHSPACERMLSAIPSMTQFGGITFGNTEDPDIKAAMEPWTTWKAAPIISGSLGGKSYSFLQKAVFKDTAARDTAVAAIKAANLGDHGGSFFVCPQGDSQLWIVHYAKDEAGNKGIQSAFGADPALMAAFTNGNITHLPHYNAGNFQNTWASDFEGWRAAIPALYNTDSPLVCHREGGSFGPDCFTFIQEIEFTDAAGYSTFLEVNMDPAIMNDPIKYNMSIWKTSPTTAVALYTFGASDDWMECNKNFFPHAEALGPAMKKVMCYISGPVSANAQAGLDGWSGAPWAHFHTVERVGQMGK